MPDTRPALLEIVYSSETPVPMGSEEVRALLDHSRRNNAQAGVTGLLCYDRHQFLQIIEGETDVILDLFHTIQNDPRHTDLRILHEGDIKDRAFSDWKMAYEPVPSGLLPTLTRAIHRQPLALDGGGKTSAGRRIFTLFMDEMYGGQVPERETADAV
ncbi:BLUF domain-containing protein [uncultured Algimonas sp.]|uniref:BLUF domain-containing protein n=1 Tax=uncultured Algimonas sp. TaxID=1547920 RepID=UPI00262A9843|nr:BLUF domain-containing protein [uncultured Algimonas sp.]